MSDFHKVQVSDEAKQRLLQAMKVEKAKKQVMAALNKNGSLDEAIAVQALRNMMKEK